MMKLSDLLMTQDANKFESIKKMQFLFCPIQSFRNFVEICCAYDIV